MTKPSFLARQTFGQPNYLLAAMACAFVLALIPRGAWKALNSATTDFESWLPSSTAEVQNIEWFRRHFGGDQFAIVSWDGCTLANDQQLEWLAKKLTARPADAQWYASVTTGPRVIREMMDAHAGLSYADAIQRVEGALVGPLARDAHGNAQDNDARTTCLVVEFSPKALESSTNLHAAVAGISRIAADDCDIKPEALHLGGPPVDRASVDAEGAVTLLRLAPLAGLAGALLCLWRLQSLRLTALVFGVATACAALSLAIVFYLGVFEVGVIGRAAPHWGVLDAVLIAMPAIVFLLATSAGLHAVNYYLHARRERGLPGAAEAMLTLGLRPAAITAVATALAIAALATSEVAPVQKFGLIAALSMFVLPAAAYSIMPIVLHRYPPTDATAKRRAPRDGAGDAPTMLGVAMRRVINHPAITLTAAAALLVAVGLGAYRLRASVQVLTLLDRDADLVRDYAWLEEHLGNLVPMEVVLTLPPERLRTGEEHAEADGQQYRLTMLERMELLRQIERRLMAFPQISRALSAATFAPPATDTGLAGVDRSGDYSKNKALEFHRDRLLATDYLQIETLPTSKRTTGRELWRMNARVAALAEGAEPIDYGALQAQLTRAVEPVLAAYQQRDQIVRALHEQGKQLDGARVCVLFRAPDKAKAPPASVQEQALAELLMVSGVAPKGVSYFNLATFEQPGRGGPTQDDAFRQSAVASLRKQDAVVLASAPSDPVAAQIAGSGVYVVNVTHFSSVAEQADAPLLDDGGPRPIRAVFTGMAPIVDRTQRSLASGLIPGLWLAAALAAVAVTLGYMSLASGALTIGPALLPLAVTLGVMGWLGLKIDLGIAMTASVALGVALEGALHMVQWHRLGLATGLDRRRAAAWAGDRVAMTLIETAAIAAAGLAVLAWSGFTPLREFGVVMITVQAAALVANLFVVPAVLASPLGWFFAPVAVRRDDPLVPKLQAWWAAFWPAKAGHVQEAADQSVVPLPKAPPAPHYGDPVPVRRTALPISTDERRELAEGPHSALHAKLQNLRRPRTGDSATS